MIRALFTVVACTAILGGATWGTKRILETEPKAQREGATRKTAMLVDLKPVEAGTFRPEIAVLGRVRPAREIQLRAQVSGRIVACSPSFVPGGLAEADQPLLEIEATDYENVVQQRKSALRQAEADLQIELGRQNVARRDYEMLAEDGIAALDGEQRRLALREPQIAAARAHVASARAALDQAELDLERTRLRMPFAVQVLDRSANVGSHVSPGEDLARLVGVDTYWVIASVPLRSLRWIGLEEEGDGGAVARVRNRAAWPEGTFREGRVLRLVGSLEAETRLAQVLVAIEDPLALRAETGEVPRLILDAVVEVRIEARPLEDVIRLERDYLRTGDTVWTMEEGVLRIREVDVLFQDATYAYIREGLEASAQVVTTNLATVVEGAPLRTERSP